MRRSSADQSCGNHGSPVLHRRDLLRRAGLGFGTLALAGLLKEDGLLHQARGETISGPVAGGGKARSVIFLYVSGGPSQVDTWDPKLELNRLHGKDVPASILQGVKAADRTQSRNLLGSPFRFACTCHCVSITSSHVVAVTSRSHIRSNRSRLMMDLRTL